MANLRVYELAKQYNIDSKVVKKILADNGIEVKNHMSSITAEAAEIVKNVLGSQGSAAKEQETKKQPENKAAEKSSKETVKKTNKTVSGHSEQQVSKDAPAKSDNSEKVQKNNRTDGKDKTEKSKQETLGKSHITQVYNPQNSAANKKNMKSKNNRNNQSKAQNENVSHTAAARGAQQTADGDRTGKKRNNAPASEEVNAANQNPGRNNQVKNNQNRNNDNRNSDNRSNDNGRSNNRRDFDRQQDIPQETNQESGKKKKNKNKNNGNQNNESQLRDSMQFGKKNKKNAQNNQKSAAPVSQPKEEEIKEIVIPESLTIKELADKMKMQPSALVKKLFMQGQIVTINQEIDFDTAQEIALEYDIIAEMEEKVDIIEELLREDEEDEKKLVKRPPVVCVMGHVDHGKTSLLDAIRQTNVIAREAGGITQHIGAYTVEINGEQITFLDTPGHEAFTAMRMRGAQSTDIAILVVAADDGVMPQTVEAINHARAAGISIIVAVNKIDKPSANVDRVKQELAEYDLVAEDWGGDTIFVPVSAHTKEGIDTLLEMILLEAEVCELKANPNRKARGLVIEAQLDKGRGPVATVLVQKGTLRIGDAIAAGSHYGKVRAMINDKGERVATAGPSMPVEILGLNGVPNAGEVFVSTKNDKEARNFAETFIKDGREKLLESSKAKAKMSLDDLFSQIQEGELKELDIIVKADVQGSVEAVKQSLVKLSNDEVVVKVIHAGVGAINESDVILASASNAIIIGFNVRPDNMAKDIAEREKVDLRLYRVIYQAIADVEAAMKGLLDPIFEEKVIGHAEIRQLFKASGVGTIAGSYVLDGIFRRGCSARITRDGEQIFDGALASLKRFKDDVKEVKANYECGLVFEKFNDIQEGDIVEAYVMEEVPR